MLQRTNNMSPSSPSAWRTPTLILVCGCIILTLSMGIRHTGGLFLQPMTGALGWNREVFSFAFAIQNLVWGLGSPFAGAFADRYGAGRVIAASALLYAVGLALMAVSSTGLALDLSAGVLVGLGLSGTTFAVIMGVIGRHTTPEKRSLALGIASAGGSFGQFVFAPILQRLIQSVGWMGALWAMAIATLAALPLVGRLAGAPPAHAPTAATGGGLGQAVKEAMGDRSYLLLHAGFFTCGFHIAFLVTHLPGEVNLCGLPPSVASWSLAIIGLANIFGSLYAGSCVARYRSKYILAAMYASRALLIIWYLMMPRTEWTYYLFAAGLGFTWLATVPPTAAIVGKLFGVRYLGTLFGLTLLSHQIGGFLGAYLGGLTLTRFGDYGWMWYADIALAAAAALVNLPIRERPVQPVAQPA